MNRIVLGMVKLMLCLILGCTVVFGQATAQISATVRDQSGAVLPGVEVTATQTDTGIVRNVVTNETGSYVLPILELPLNGRNITEMILLAAAVQGVGGGGGATNPFTTAS
jgi:hypothetical protein